MIDLHTHTKYSDGTWDLRRMLSEAQAAGLEILSITDHDTLKAYYELKNTECRDIYNGQILTGVELNVVYNGVKFELLAYGFDIDKLNEWIYQTYETKQPDLEKEFEYMYNSCKKNGLRIDELRYDKAQGWPVDKIFEGIKKYDENRRYFSNDEWESIDVFYNSCITNTKFPAYVDFAIHFPTADIVARKVRETGGKLFVAHVFKYNLKDTTSFLDALKENNIIDGVEVYHSTFTPKMIETLEKYCISKNLLVSGGSDCHGDKKPDRKIGIGYGNLKIPKQILNNWDVQDKLI